MYKEEMLEVVGCSPLLMHSRKKLGNPLHPLTKEIKRFSGKKNKTEEDLLAIAKLEWLGGMYLTEDAQVEIKGGEIEFFGGGEPCLPGEVWESTIISGAKKHKLGQQFKSGIIVDGDFPLIYEGPKTASELWKDVSYIDMRNVKIQRNLIMRCRPLFNKWASKIVVSYLPSVVDLDKIKEALATAGILAGVGDYRPKYGRFNLVES